MNPQEDFLSQTLAKVRANVEPSPELLDAIRAAIVRAERRRRLVALCVTLAVLLATLLALFILVSIRTEGPPAQAHPPLAQRLPLPPTLTFSEGLPMEKTNMPDPPGASVPPDLGVPAARNARIYALVG